MISELYKASKTRTIHITGFLLSLVLSRQSGGEWRNDNLGRQFQQALIQSIALASSNTLPH